MRNNKKKQKLKEGNIKEYTEGRKTNLKKKGKNDLRKDGKKGLRQRARGRTKRKMTE